ncbi:hypothetical protein AB0J38_18305 [Streptomyces sp. NPDC050095]|uniref:hypothetical protein n=1 Tax=unclassified Streptomyces TaxID=2593676 RepID=UPI00342A9A3C
MTGIGPVEPYDPQGTPPATTHLDTIGSNSPRLTDLWTTLPPRRRRIAAGILALAAATTALLVLRPTPADPTPSPWPATTTTLEYDGPALDNGAFRFTVHVRTGSPVTIRQLESWLPELGASTTPRLPLTVKPGEPGTLTVWFAIYSCSGLPHGIDIPQLDLVLRNQRAQQQHSFLFGGAFARDLWSFLGANCGPALPPEAPAPPAGNPHTPPGTISHVGNTQLPLSQ